MTLIELLILLLIAGLAGAAGQALVGYTRGGCLGSIAVGFVGAILGTWIARSLGLPAMFAVQVAGSAFPVIWSVIGAALFVAVLSAIAGRR